MDKLYVQQYGQLENSHWWFIIRQKIILLILRKFIPADKNGNLKILNAGAASGGSSQWLCELGEVLSLENDPAFLSVLSGKAMPFVKGSVTGIPLENNSFDLVCAFDVIEHVENDRKAIEELIRVCKPGGFICITVPAFQSLWGNHDKVNGHYRRYRQQQLRKLVEGRPVIVSYYSYFNFFLFLPVLLFRKVSSIFYKKRSLSDSDFAYFKTSHFINKMLKGIFGIEIFLLRLVRLPFGVSLLMLFQKSPLPANAVQ